MNFKSSQELHDSQLGKSLPEKQRYERMIVYSQGSSNALFMHREGTL